jgi:hypothetical protein
MLVLLTLLVPGLLLGGQAAAAPDPDRGPTSDRSVTDSATDRATDRAEDRTPPRDRAVRLAGGQTDQPPVAARQLAEQVLAEAQRLMARKPREEAAATLEQGRDITLLLRELWLRQEDLSSEDQVAARSLQIRPATNRSSCAESWGNTAPVCVHWSDSGAHAASEAYAQQTLQTMTHVHNTYAAAGYRSPKDDRGLAGQTDARPDIYLQDLAPQGFYGYCTIDQGRPQPAPDRYDVPAFCVLDNDYRPGQYGTRHTPTEFLQATAAHEYFHAVQFAYDATEDHWFMEGSATWAEDYVYDAINDNLQYLRHSPLTAPRVSMDYADARNGLLKYGTWIFFRYLSERYPDSAGGLPTVVRELWERADSSRGSRYDAWSTKAVHAELSSHGTSLRAAFAHFSAINRHPRRSYEEGAANRYPAARPADRTVLRRPGAGVTRTYSVDHLASATHRFVPRRLSGRHTKLRVAVDLPARRIGTAAVLTVYRKDGRISTWFVRINRRGNGVKKVAFSNRSVKYVDLTLVNASARMRCWQYTSYSCAGVPVHDNQRETLSARVVRR